MYILHQCCSERENPGKTKTAALIPNSILFALRKYQNIPDARRLETVCENTRII